MGINSIFGSTGSMRIGGLATGLDTDSIVKDLMKIEQMKVDKLKQDRQIIEWRKEDYREIANLLRGFKDDFFDILNKDNYMLSPDTYRTFEVSSSDSTYVTATANSEASPGTYTIDSITSLATAAHLDSASAVSAPLQGKIPLTGTLDLTGKNFVLNVDGVSKTITFNNSYLDTEYSTFVNDLQDLLDDAFGTGRVTASVVDDGGNKYVKLSADNTSLTITEGTNSALTELGFHAGQSNRISLDASLESVSLATPISFGAGDTIQFSINGESFTFSKTDSLRDIMTAINDSDAGVTLSYSSITDTFTLKAKETGAGKNITITNLEGNFFGAGSAIGITADFADNGTNAVFSLNNETVIRSTNTFTIDGVTYTLKDTIDAVDGPVTLTVEQDIDTAYDNIKAFVEKYNEVIGKINEELEEERDRDYLPLTEAQKEEMSEKEIELWEEKARSGLLKGDTILQDIVYNMRKALIDAVDDVGITLSEIGITTGSYEERGKLYIDEDELKAALREKGEQVMSLFSKEPSIGYSPDLTSSQKEQRYNQAGVMHRISDILLDNIRTTRNNNGDKGILLEKAGIVGDITEFENMMDDQLETMDERIDRALETMYQREDRYWREFAALETAINQMNQQSMWLMQQFGGGQ